MRLRKWSIRILKIAAWFIFSLVLLLILIIIVIRIPAVQQAVTQRAITFLEQKLNTRVALHKILVSFPKKIVLEGFYIEDQAKDTLLYAGEISINTNFWKLLDHEIQLNDVTVDRTVASIYRLPSDHAFNFSFVTKAFADTTKTDTLSSAPWKFAIQSVALANIRFAYRDGMAGDAINVRLGELNVAFDKFDLSNAVYRVDEFSLRNTNVNVYQSATTSNNTDSIPPGQTFLPDISVRRIALDRVVVRYEQQGAGRSIYVDAGKLAVAANKIDLQNQIVSLNDLRVSDTFVSYQQMKTAAKPLKKEDVDDSAAFVLPLVPWRVSADRISFSNNSIRFDNFNKPFVQDGFDPNHLWISDLTTTIDNLALTEKEVGANIQEFSMTERNGLPIRRVRGNINLTNTHLALGNFVAETARSRVELTGDARYSSLSRALSKPETMAVDIPHMRMVIGMADILYFKRDLFDSIPVGIPTDRNVTVTSSLQGTLGNLTVQTLEVRALAQTSLAATGRIRNLPDLKNAVMKINLEKFYTVRSDVLAVIDSSKVNSIEFPAWLRVQGKFEGNLLKPSIQSLLTSDMGSIDIKTIMSLDTITHRDAYTGDVVLSNVDLGRLLKQPDVMGAITMKASISGTGITMDDIQAKVNLAVDSFRFHNYAYRNFEVHGMIKKFFFDGKAALRDENLDVAINGDVDYNGTIPRYKLTLDLKNADFNALHLSDRPLRARGTLNVDLATSDMKVLNGSVAVRKVAIFNGQALYKVDSMLFASIDQDGQTTIRLSSDVVSGNFSGTMNLFGMPDALKRYVDHYFSLQKDAEPPKAENFKFDLMLKKTELLTDIIFPSLKSFEPGPIKGEFNNLENKLNIHIALGKIHFSDYMLDSVLLNVNSTKQAITCELMADNFRYDSIRLYAMKVDSRIAHDSIRAHVVILDSLNGEKYKIGGVFRSLEQIFQFHFTKEDVVLNYTLWDTPSDNYIRFGHNGITTHNVALANNNEKIVVERSTDSTAMLHIGFQNVELATLSAMVSGKKPIVEGYLNGDLNFPILPRRLFHASVQIKDLVILKQPWGNIDLSARDLSEGTVKVGLSLQGENIDIHASGTYTTNSSDITGTIAKINLKIIEPLFAKSVRDMRGAVSGNFSIRGDLKRPAIQGALTFTDAHFVPTYVNSGFRLKNETITFNENGILFSNFQILDDGNNIATLRGSILTKRYTDFELDLKLATTNFQVLNTGPKDNTLYYGKVKINAKAAITGNLRQPVIDMSLAFSDDTQLTYVVPQSEKGVLDQKGIVVFVDKDEKHDPFLSSIHLADTVHNAMKGFFLTANIELSNKEIFNIVIDPITGDKLSVQGSSTLTFEMNPNGNMNLSGRYEIAKGSYALSFYKLVKRNFTIDKGSSITWYGDPLNAILDIKAIYTVETSPLELMAAQIPGTPSEQYKQRVPFYVYLIIKGELLTPAISFQLDMPQDKRNIFSGSVYAKLQDVNTRDADVNKQVFALLVLQRFMADNPFENQAAGDLATSARTSVSRILSDQLNRLSQNVKGVQLSFDVKSYEDYTSGQAAGQTQLQLGVSKNLLNDRLVVKLSGNVDVEGENNAQNSLTDYIGDLALEYKITSDGRLRVTGFRNSDYDMIDGELTKTGAGLIYIKDYNAFKELFKANEKQQ